MAPFNVCDYCGRSFPEGAVTACPVHEVLYCSERPDDDQQRLTDYQ